MPNKNRQELYDKFATGSKPTQDDFADLIDSMINIVDDGIGVSEKGKPMEVVQQGTKQRFLDFSSAQDNPVWRIGGQSNNGVNGLNVVTADEKSRLFIKKENGFIGINNDDPRAKLHITPDSDITLQVDCVSGKSAFLIGADGSIGIGTDTQESYKVSMGGNINVKENATIDGSLSVNKGIIINDGAKIETGKLAVKSGMTVNEGAVIESGKLEAKNGITVNNGAKVESGRLEAQKGLTVNEGAVIESGKLEAKNGITVNDGVIVQTGVLSAYGGLSITEGSTLSADGPVSLGKAIDGVVTINGELKANNGVMVSGGELVAKNGINVSGNLNVPDSSTLGNAKINTLNVTDINIMGNLGLQSVNLNSLQADNAEINSITSGHTAILGPCQASDNVVFDSGKIYITYEGPVSFRPKFKIVKGTVTGETEHFDIAVDNNKLITITYDVYSDVNNLVNDWEEYQNAHPEEADGFCLLKAGEGRWEPQEQQYSLAITDIFKEYIVTENGLRIMYIADTAATPRFEIKAKEDTESEGFEFIVDGENLTIKYPENEELRTVNQLLFDWQKYLSYNLKDAGDFEIRKTADSTGEVLVNDVASTELIMNTTGNIFCKAIIKTNTVKINGSLKFEDSEVMIDSVSKSDSMAENSDGCLPTQKAVKTYVDNGLALKADQSFVIGELEKKADQNFVLEELEKKADQTYVDAELSEKADVTTVATALAGKANMIKPDEFSIEQGATVTGEEISLTGDYRGVLMVTVTASSNNKAGLYAVCGTDSIIKIAGDGLSDQQDHADTLNVYTDGGVLMFQNALTDGVVVKATAFGG